MSSSDDHIWSCVNEYFCCFKVKTPKQTFCKNPHNVTGLCNRRSCELANSSYATIMEKKGKVFLCIKTPERAHLPSRLWEYIELPRNYEEALKIIEDHLEYNKWNKEKCQRRLTMVFDFIKRERQMRLQPQENYETINKKIERREKSREAKAEKAARLEQTFQAELIKNFQENKYQGVYNFPQKEFNQSVDQMEIEDLEEEKEPVFDLNDLPFVVDDDMGDNDIDFDSEDDEDEYETERIHLEKIEPIIEIEYEDDDGKKQVETN
eukprot:TRINITY_DN3292_c0_g2_i2.p1 TRINITY_DN3292_c0_g2~~TRINITY_DN3292_c0_g2_i2.p1  ORF type:complete len:265 (-),score=70.37 TRINITY_DN3292_c0_g2_i2:195-989(-)